MRLHGEGLRHVLRADTHDRPDVWFVLEDGSNLDAVADDLVKAVSTQALPFLDRVHDPSELALMAEADALRARRGSPVVNQLVEAATGRARDFR
jgi:hypothetical protein